MHNPGQTSNMQMAQPDPRLHHNMQTDLRQGSGHSIQSIDPRSTPNLQNNRPDNNNMQNMDPRMTGSLNSSQSATNQNEQRDQQIGQKRERTSDMVVSMVPPPNKLSLSDKMMSPAAHCNTCNCHLQNDSFPMREQGKQLYSKNRFSMLH